MFASITDCMGRLDVEIPDDLEKEFRLAIIENIGGKKGSIKQAMMEAIRLWIDNNKKEGKEV